MLTSSARRSARAVGGLALGRNVVAQMAANCGIRLPIPLPAITSAFTSPARSVLPSYRTFVTSSPLLKKGGSKKSKNKKNDEEEEEDDDDDNTPSNSVDTFDANAHFTDLTTTLQKHLSKLQDDLSRLRGESLSPGSGSSQNPTAAGPIATLENLQISIDKSKPSETVSLRDLAHVTPRPSSRRHLQITVHDAAHVKKIISTIQRADLNMQPVQEDPVNNPLVLTLPLPPPTRESRELLASQANKLAEGTRGQIRLVRMTAIKKIKGALGKKRPDEGVVEKARRAILEN
ncbi:ribosome recycling factor-domain-containing protein [Kalaharituber pfeilii]|nr:ribosome recycling factor-domain-containing protein [Kalaharituber pfeilii]